MNLYLIFLTFKPWEDGHANKFLCILKDKNLATDLAITLNNYLQEDWHCGCLEILV